MHILYRKLGLLKFYSCKRIKVSNAVWYVDFVQNNIAILANYYYIDTWRLLFKKNKNVLQKINKYDKYDSTTFPNHLPHVMQD